MTAMAIGQAPGRARRNNVSEFVREQAECDPDRPLLSWVTAESRARWVRDRDGELSHGLLTADQLWQSVQATARSLAELGLGPGDRALIFLPMSAELYVAMLAVQHMGAAAVFLDSWARRDELELCVEIADPRALITTPEVLGLAWRSAGLGRIPLRVVCGGTMAGLPRLEELMRNPRTLPTQAVDPEQTALITFTTGTTGRPKGADRSHRFLAAQHTALAPRLPYSASDRDLPLFPIFCLNNLAAGVPTVLPALDLAVPAAHDAALLAAQIRSAAVTCLTLSPRLCRELGRWCEEEGRTLAGLRRVVTGGAPVSRDELERMQRAAPEAEILVLYGSTEVEPIAHISLAEQRARGERERPGVDVGRLHPGLRHHFVRLDDVPHRLPSDETWSSIEATPGQPGELVVAGDHVCPGYFRDPEATRRTKIIDARGLVWHRTGDVGQLDAEGHLWLLGRVHNVIAHRSGWLFPVQAELLLRSLPFVRQAALLGMPRLAGPAEAWCVLEPRPDARGDRAEMTSAALALLEQHGVPCDAIRFVDHIPTDPRHHSKVQYAALRDALEA